MSNSNNVETLRVANRIVLKEGAVIEDESGKILFSANQVLIPVTVAPTNYSAGVTPGTLGVKGEVRFDGTYLYVCVNANTATGTNWRRVSLGTAY